MWRSNKWDEQFYGLEHLFESFMDCKYKVGDSVIIKHSNPPEKGIVRDTAYYPGMKAAEYYVQFGDRYGYFHEMELLPGLPEDGVKCECGAQKVYGSRTTKAHHALWCPLRK